MSRPIAPLAAGLLLAAGMPFALADPASDCVNELEMLRPCMGLHEDFEGEAPGWTFEGVTGELGWGNMLFTWRTDDREIQPAGYVNGYWHLRHRYGDRELLYASDVYNEDYPNLYNYGPHWGHATSPPFVVPYSGPRLTYAYEPSYYYYGPVRAEITIDGGESWRNLGRGGYHDLSEFAGQVAQIRFVYTATSGYYAWSIDDVDVRGAASAMPTPPLRAFATAGWLPGENWLTWAAPIDPGNAGEVMYDVYRWTASAPARKLIGSTDELTFFDPGLDPLLRYYYAIRARNAYGTSAYSNEASATPDPLDERWTIDDDCNSNNEDVYVCAHGNPHAGLAAIVLCGDPRAPIVITAGRLCEHIGE